MSGCLRKPTPDGLVAYRGPTVLLEPGFNLRVTILYQHPLWDAAGEKNRNGFANRVGFGPPDLPRRLHTCLAQPGLKLLPSEIYGSSIAANRCAWTWIKWIARKNEIGIDPSRREGSRTLPITFESKRLAGLRIANERRQFTGTRMNEIDARPHHGVLAIPQRFYDSDDCLPPCQAPSQHH